MISLATYPDFKAASAALLDFLQTHFAFQMWMVTRLEADELTVLFTSGRGYNVKADDVFDWADTPCSRMVKGLGPRIAPNLKLIPAYANISLCRNMDIGAYVGVPLVRSDGTLFGTLCAIDPRPMQEKIESELPLIELVARQLMTIQEFEWNAQEERRRAELASTESATDLLTGLNNRRGWEKIVAAENLRCQRYGHPCCLLSIDLDELKWVNDKEGHAAGDALLCSAAQALMSSVRETDVVARIGGDEFAVLGVECDPAGADALFQRISKSLKAKNVSASIGMAIWDSQGSLSDCFKVADQKMYENKHHRKSPSPHLPRIGADRPQKNRCHDETGD